MFPMQECYAGAETRREDSIECAPIARVDYMGVGIAYNAADLQDCAYAVAGSLVEFVIANRVLQPVEEFSGRCQQTQFVFEIGRRPIDYVDKAILQATMRE